MPSYESIVIIRPSLSDEETTGIIEKLKGSVEKLGASLLKAENWGRKKLAYEVRHDRRGTYLQLQFEGEGRVVSQLERLYRLEDSIMKFITVRMEPEDLQPTTTGEVEVSSGGIQ